MDAKTASKIDLLVLSETAKCGDPGMNLEFDLSKAGITESDLDQRLHELAGRGYITILESVGQTTVTSITQAGAAYLQSLGGA